MGDSDGEGKLVKVLRVSCWLNHTVCRLKLKDFQEAIKLCSKVLDIEFCNVKALYRRAQAYTTTGDLENEFSMSNLQLSETRKKIEVAAAGLDTIALADEAFNMEDGIDRCILRLIASCCNGDKLVRATELARLLTLEKSLKGAIKLVTALKLPLLLHFNGILEERLLCESGAVFSPNVTSKCNITNVQFRKSSPASQIRTAEPSKTLPSTSLPHPHFSNHGKIDKYHGGLRDTVEEISELRP